jgi:hypothetical protein
MKTTSTNVASPFVAAVLACALGTAAYADFDLGWYTIDGGGGMWSTGGSFELSAAIGQPDAGVVLTGGAFELTGGFWALPTAPSVLVGDLDCDGTVGFGDINPFVLSLTNPALWQQTYPDCPWSNGDINADGSVDFGDINPFVALLTGGG